MKYLIRKIKELINLRREYIAKLNSAHLIISEYKLCYKEASNIRLLALIEQTDPIALKNEIIKTIKESGINNIERDFISKISHSCLFEQIEKLKEGTKGT